VGQGAARVILFAYGGFRTLEPWSPHEHFGRLIRPDSRDRLEDTAATFRQWAADNGAFNPQVFSELEYSRMLARLDGMSGCRFVTVPDVVGDGPLRCLLRRWHDGVEAVRGVLCVVSGGAAARQVGTHGPREQLEAYADGSSVRLPQR
jgi:hypothetical protein